MTRSSFLLDEGLEAYVRAHNPQPDDLVRELVAETGTLPSPGMATAPEQAAFLGLLVRLTGARSILEIGVFTGMSSLAMARALPAGGRIVACDVSEEWTAIARRYWERAGVADRVDLRLGPAAETVAALPEEPTFDLAFIDADKPGYPRYLELVVPRLLPGALLVADNVLWHGAIADPDDDEDGTQSLRRFNDAAAADPRLETYLLAVFDGLLLARRR